MLNDDLDYFTAIWMAALETYSKKPTDMAISMAFRTLERFEIDDVKRAITAHMNDSDQGRFAPKPSDIVRHIEGDPESKNLLAWTAVEDTLRRVSRYESIVFDDPAIMATIKDMGGWTSFHEKTEDELPFVRNEFVKRYKGYRIHPPTSWPKKFIGISEASNAMTGHHSFIKEPLLIGDERKAALVYQGGSEQRKGPARLGDVLKTMQLEHKHEQ